MRMSGVSFINLFWNEESHELTTAHMSESIKNASHIVESQNVLVLIGFRYGFEYALGTIY